MSPTRLGLLEVGIWFSGGSGEPRRLTGVEFPIALKLDRHGPRDVELTTSVPSSRDILLAAAERLREMAEECDD